MLDDTSARKLVEVRNLQMYFPIYTGLFRKHTGDVKAVDGVNFDIYEGETLGLVGESGCGKSTCGRAVLRLYEPTDGSVQLEGQELGWGNIIARDIARKAERWASLIFFICLVLALIRFVFIFPAFVIALGFSPIFTLAMLALQIGLLSLCYIVPRWLYRRLASSAAGISPTDFAPSERALRRLRPTMQMVFQDPQASLNPRMTVAAIIGEPLSEHTKMTGAERNDRIYELLDAVGLNRDFANRYPHEFSGGQRQRIGIARALVLNPRFIVCDEVTSALDVSVQARVLALLDELRRDFDLTYLFITHNIDVVRYFADDVAVMYQGRVVEQGDVASVCERPANDYTRRLLAAVPQFEAASEA